MLQQQYNGLAVKGLHKRIGKVSTAVSLTLVGLMAQMPAWAAGALEGEVKKQPLNISAIIMFLIFVFATLGITYWASKQNRKRLLYRGRRYLRYQKRDCHCRGLYVSGNLFGVIEYGFYRRL